MKPGVVAFEPDLFSPVDRVKMTGHCARIDVYAGPAWHSKAWWAETAGCSEHALSARFSDMRKVGYTVDRRKAVDDGSGDKLVLYQYRVVRPV